MITNEILIKPMGLYTRTLYNRTWISLFCFIQPGTNKEELPTIDVYVNMNFDGSYEGHPIRQFVIRRPEEEINSGMSWELLVLKYKPYS